MCRPFSSPSTAISLHSRVSPPMTPASFPSHYSCSRLVRAVWAPRQRDWQRSRCCLLSARRASCCPWSWLICSVLLVAHCWSCLSRSSARRAYTWIHLHFLRVSKPHCCYAAPKSHVVRRCYLLSGETEVSSLSDCSMERPWRTQPLRRAITIAVQLG